jgi:peptidoglycan-associated lipoprotein
MVAVLELKFCNLYFFIASAFWRTCTVGTQSIKFFRTTILALSIVGLAACSSTGDEEVMASAPAASSTNDAAAAAARAEADRIAREREAQQRLEAAALATTVFYFDFDVSEFMAADRDVLAIHGRNLAANSNRRIRLEGHADERGTREYNLALGERRANSIRDYLVVNGASMSQIETVSYGEERPADPGQTEAAYRLNRRVEIR